MNFQNLVIKSEYRTLFDNISKDFYEPLLKYSVSYDRAVGFFSSTVLCNISKGIEALVNNDGKIRLVASPYLSEDDIEAIKNGYAQREIYHNAILRQLKQPCNSFEEDRLNLLSELIAFNKMDIKIALTKSNNLYGMYHEKMGIMKDGLDNIVSFSGSMNESGNAIKTNYEVIDVWCSWKSTEQKHKVEIKKNAFSCIWDNSDPNIEILHFPDLSEEIIKRYKRKKVYKNLDEQQLFVNEKNQTYDSEKKDIIKPDNLDLYDYQKIAIQKWKESSFCGIFSMATGTGKTITALSSLVELYDYCEKHLAIIIVCPFQHLVEQWAQEVENFNINPIIGYSNSSQKNWFKRLKLAISCHKNKIPGQSFFCFITTNATYSSQRVQNELLKINKSSCLVVDEAHNFGAEKISKLMLNNFEYRLGLSATIERHNDEEGTNKLFNYFGPVCLHYSLDQAIKEQKLTSYRYYPIPVILNEYELEEYISISKEISKCIIYDKQGNVKGLNEKGKNLAIKRSRVVAGLSEKVSKLEELMQNHRNDSHILVYCGATSISSDFSDLLVDESNDIIRQIDLVTGILGNKLGMKVSQFTSKENMKERERLLKEFEKGENLQALIAIKCLDEGVNIPAIKIAYILASTRNPKEYIQRRGRVLRLHPHKQFSLIYDFISLPRELKKVHYSTNQIFDIEINLVKKELMRAKEFSRLSMNFAESERILNEIADIYSINIEEIETMEDIDDEIE